MNYEYPPIGGGGGWASSQIAKQLVVLGHQVSVLTTDSGLSKTTRRDEDGVSVWRCASYRPDRDRAGLRTMASFVVHARRTLPQVMDAHRPEVCLIFFAFPTGLLGLGLLSRWRIPYAVAFRGGDVPGLEQRVQWMHLLLKPLMKRILRHSAAATVNARSMAPFVAKLADEQVTVIPNGVDVEFFAPNDGFRTSLPTFVCGGRLQAQKNIVLALDAMADIAECRMTVVGDGPLRPSLEKRVHSLGISDRVRFTGWLTREALRQELQKSWALINTSHYEGHSNLALEAMACGLPVLASDVVGNSELVVHEQTGLLVANESSWVQVLKNGVARPDDLRRMGARARIFVVENASWMAAAKRYADLLGRLAMAIDSTVPFRTDRTE